MECEMHYNVRSVGGSRFVVSAGYIHAMVNGVEPSVTLFTREACLMAPSWRDLVAAAADLPKWLDHMEEQSFLSLEDGSGTADCSIGNAKLKFCSDEFSPAAISRLTNKLRKIAPLLEAAETEVGQSRRVDQVANSNVVTLGSAPVKTGIERKVAKIKRIALRTRGWFSDLGRADVDPDDPYCLFSESKGGEKRKYFLHDGDTDVWVWLGDLPKCKAGMMRQWIDEGNRVQPIKDWRPGRRTKIG
jgi:hypothetical protein